MKYCYADYNIDNACVHFSQVHSLHAYRHVIHKCVFTILYERTTTLRLSVKAAVSSYVSHMNIILYFIYQLGESFGDTVFS